MMLVGTLTAPEFEVSLKDAREFEAGVAGRLVSESRGRDSV